MTDDSHGAQRGGVPVPEDAGATASAAPSSGVVGHPGPVVPPQAHGHDPDATVRYSTASGHAPGAPTQPAAGLPAQPAAGLPAQPAGLPAQPASGLPVQAPEMPILTNGEPAPGPVSGGATAPSATPAPLAGYNPQTPQYGPFHTSPHPTSGGTPWTAAPTSDAGPTSSPPNWSAANPTSGATAPISGPGNPVSAPGSPISGAPIPPSGTDEYGLPTSGGNHFGGTGYGANRFGGSTGSPADPYSQSAAPADPYSQGAAPAGPFSRSPAPADPYSQGSSDADRFGFDVAPSYSGPRIEPTPKQPKSRIIIPALAGLVAGLLIFGTAGWFAGRATAPGPGPAATTVAGPAPSASATQGVYEQNQVTINQPKFAGSLGTVAQGWLPHLSGCSRNGDKGGPKLTKGEKARVRCEMDAMSVIFVEYATTADRDKARVTTLGQNVDARTLTPGVGAAVERATPSGRTTGNYVEYAYKVSGRTVAGIWWDDTETPVAAYVLAYWKEGVGEKWEPMRDIWARYA
ncbi:hypothetical protein [Actinoplanes sp. NPDC049316]|uniref:hypothetical protein n=1 Tax=Actinoplanes sp. NPDC049316 TaxID=3154727 RepID=UPI0034314213